MRQHPYIQTAKQAARRDRFVSFLRSPACVLLVLVLTIYLSAN